MMPIVLSSYLFQIEDPKPDRRDAFTAWTSDPSTKHTSRHISQGYMIPAINKSGQISYLPAGCHQHQYH